MIVLILFYVIPVIINIIGFLYFHAFNKESFLRVKVVTYLDVIKVVLGIFLPFLNLVSSLYFLAILIEFIIRKLDTPIRKS